MSRVDFTINPDTIVQVTEKPTRNVFKNAEAVPRAKYNFAVTSNMEYGWDQPDPRYHGKKERGKQWNHNNNSCDETKYATAYITDQGHNPFQNVGDTR